MAAIRDGHHQWLVIFAVICSAISAYYYFKIIQAMFFKEAGMNTNSNSLSLAAPQVTGAFRGLLVVTAIVIIVLGLFPSLLTDWLHYQ